MTEQENISETTRKLTIGLLEIILKYNIFEFDKEKYIQNIGTAMGTEPAPPYANIFMANKIDPKIIEIAKTFAERGENPIKPNFLKGRQNAAKRRDISFSTATENYAVVHTEKVLW